MAAFDALKIGLRLAVRVLSICCLGFAAVAHAQYVGAGFGQSRFSGDVGADLITAGSTDTQHTAFKVFGGYVFKSRPHFSAELAYVDLGKLHYRGTFEGVANEGTVKFSGFDLSAVGSVRVRSSSVFAKVGVFAWSAEASSVPGVFIVGLPGVKNGQDLSVGLGASLELSPAWSLRAEWDRFKLDVANTRLITIGAAYRFEE